MVTILVALLLQQPVADLDTVIRRATDYVSRYEAELGNLIGTEYYVQNATLLDSSTPPRVAQRMQRRTSSDFLIIQVGTEWAAIRKVNRVDGGKVKEKPIPFEDAFDDSPAANSKRLQDMNIESTEYNLGSVRRDINLPTFALKVLRRQEVPRFSFERAGTAKINGLQTWKIRFHETSGQSLVVAANGAMLYSSGMLWIEPDTGRVIQTEFELDNPYSVPHVKGHIVVTYNAGRKTQLLVPESMTERYESTYTIVECRADYSNFRPFEVDVKFEIAAPQEGK
jgi:hypothetical protein